MHAGKRYRRNTSLSGGALLLALLLSCLPPTATQASVACADYVSQAAAQQAYRSDPVALATLDTLHDGIACQGNPAPFDRTPVGPTQGSAPAVTVMASNGVPVWRYPFDPADATTLCSDGVYETDTQQANACALDGGVARWLTLLPVGQPSTPWMFGPR
jgi:hypothetical protein